MKFFIDSGNLNDIKKAASMGILDGVTTNPSLIAKENASPDFDLFKHYKTICEIAQAPVSAEVLATDYDGMMKEAEELAKIDPHIVVKIPMIEEGIKAIVSLTKKGIRTNCTLIFSVGQALIAAKAGASYVSPFIGRLDDVGAVGLDLISDIRCMFDNYDFETEILAASIRSIEHAEECAKIGADVMTAPLSVIEKLFKHPLTDAGLAKFLSDYANSKKSK